MRAQPDATSALRESLRTVHAAGRHEHEDIDLAFDEFATGALEAIRRGLERSIPTPSANDLAHALETSAGTDLYLARGCEAARPAAWERLHDLLRPRLQGLARRRGARGIEADRIASEVLADLALPPPRGGAKTLLGTFAGRGSLFGWLAVILVRRMASEARRKRPVDMDPEVAAAQGGQPRPAATKDPAASVEADEMAARFRESLRHAWATLTPRERLVVILKYRDGLRQRVVARILAVGEPRVSRLLGQALRKLATTARAVRASPGAWPGLVEALENELARFGGELAPPPIGEKDGEPA